jgi:hypothetical protein
MHLIGVQQVVAPVGTPRNERGGNSWCLRSEPRETAKMVGKEGLAMLRYFAFTLCALTACSAHAQSSASATAAKVLAMRAGPWSVMRAVDPMTDRPDCIGIYKDSYDVQLSKTSMYVRVQGGIQLVTMRFGDEAAKPGRLPTKMEKDVRAVILQPMEFEEMRAQQRLRMTVLTMVSGVQSFDINGPGIEDAIASIASDCPAVAAEPVRPAPIAVAAPAEAPTACSPELKARLRQARVTETQIATACR